jgi:hypothetical protein
VCDIDAVTLDTKAAMSHTNVVTLAAKDLIIDINAIGR